MCSLKVCNTRKKFNIIQGHADKMSRGQTVGREDICREPRNRTQLWLNLKLLSSHLDVSSSQLEPVPRGQACSHNLSHVFLSCSPSCSFDSVEGACKGTWCVWKVATSAHLEAYQMASSVLFIPPFWLISLA